MLEFLKSERIFSILCLFIYLPDEDLVEVETCDEKHK